MSLTSLTYLIFLFVCVCAYYVLPKQARKLSLLAFSVFFYCYAMPNQLLIIMIYVWITFFMGICLKKASDGKRKPILFLGIIISVGVLFFYKYLNFTISIFNGREDTFSLIVPIGISYISFQCISYIVEVYKRKMEAVEEPVSFFAYMLLFMKVTAGPIEPPQKFFENLDSKKTIKWHGMLRGIVLIAMGFVKKMVIADSLAPYVAQVFESPAGKDGLSVLLAVVMYTLQIYFDFSGYTDIARGSAKLFGISLTENFKHPYFSKNVREFWRRWHISLSDWLKNYVYFPLGGSRVGAFRRYINVIVVFLVSGIWHGASFTFIIWGLLHGIYQVFEIMLEPVMIKVRKLLHIKEDGFLNNTLARVKTILLVMIAWIFFRAESLSGAMVVFKRLFSPWKNITWVYDNFLPDAKLLVLILISVIFVWIAESVCKRVEKIQGRAVIISVTAIWLVILSVIFTAGTATVNSFIYFDF